jgi:hypothetical protein
MVVQITYSKIGRKEWLHVKLFPKTCSVGDYEDE